MFYLQKRSVFWILTQLFLLLIQNFILRITIDDSLTHWCILATICIISNIVIQFLGVKSCDRLFSFGSVFILFSYLVNCSFPILLAFDAFPKESAIYLVFFPKHGTEYFAPAVLFALNSISFIFIGYLLFCAPLMKKSLMINKKEDYYPLKVFGILMSVVFGVIYYASTIISIILVMGSGSYSGMQLITKIPFMNTARNLQAFYFEGLFFLILYYKKTNKLLKAKAVLCVAIGSLALYFFTGVRSNPIMIMIILLLLWVTLIEKINIKKFLTFLILGLILLQGLMAIRTTRQVGFSFQSFLSSFFSFENNIIFETLSEFGTSLFVTVGFMNQGYDGNAYELFIREIGSILPNIASWGGDIFLSASVRTGFEGKYQLGCTYIGEFFYYFGKYGQYIVIIVGMWFALIDNTIRRWALQDKHSNIMIAFPAIVTTFNSVRASMSFGLKMLLYSWIIYIVFQMFVNKGKLRNL